MRSFENTIRFNPRENVKVGQELFISHSSDQQRLLRM